MITVSSLKHSAKSEDSYAYDNETLHVRLRTLRGEVDKVILWIGDPYNWAEGGLDGGNMAGTEHSAGLAATRSRWNKKLSPNFMITGLQCSNLKNAVAVTVLYFLGKRERSFFLVRKGVLISVHRTAKNES